MKLIETVENTGGNKMVAKIIALLLITFCISWAKEIEDVTVDIWKGQARIASRDLVVQFDSEPLQLEVRYKNRTPWSPGTSKWLSFKDERGGHAFTKLIAVHRRFHGFLAELVAENGQHGWLIVKVNSAKHVEIEVIPPSNTQAIKLVLRNRSSEHYYGLGDLWDIRSVDVRGYEIAMWDQSGSPDECNYVPFYMSTQGYGMFVDCSYRGVFDFGATNPEQTIVRFEAPNLSLHVWVGGNFKEILPQYLDLTGYPPLPPRWSFSPQKWLAGGTWKEVFDDVRRMQKAGMPLGVVWIDRPWMLGNYGSDDYIFDQKRYPDAPQHIAELHKMGIRLLVWGCDFLTRDSQYLSEGIQKGYVITRPGNKPTRENGQFLIDFANPEAREWWKNILRNVLRLGIDGIKVDRGQNYSVDVVPPSGRDPREMHNYHAYLLVKVFAEALAEEQGNDFQLTPRAGWAGTQRWTMKWPGDLKSNFDPDKGLPSAVRAQMSAAMTGFAFWGSDIGGYGRNLSKNCFIRWVEFGTFSPLMETVGKDDYWEAPFCWDQETVNIYRFYTRLRVKLIPYIFAMARKAHETGVPLVRHLAWEWPNDPEVHQQHYEYLFGDDLLVAPMVTESDTRQVYIPNGRWIDFWDRKKLYEGPTTITVTVPLNKIPLFIREGTSWQFAMPD